MKIVQIILILLLGAVFSIYFGFLRSRLLDKLLITFVFILGILFILTPEWLTVIAKLIGIGRGTDLMIYLFIIFFFFLNIIVFAKFRRVNKKITKLFRMNAIENAINNEMDS